MRARTVSAFAVVMLALGAFVASAAAQPPAEQKVAYHIREVASQADSAVVWDVILGLTPQTVSGASVGWRVASIEYRKDTDGVVTIWSQQNPTVHSSDGLWWVKHADVAAPALAEFTLPPEITGTALAAVSTDPNLAYSLMGSTHVSVPPPFATTGALTFSLQAEGEGEPSGKGEDEPVEVGPSGVIGGT